MLGAPFYIDSQRSTENKPLSLSRAEALKGADSQPMRHRTTPKSESISAMTRTAVSLEYASIRHSQHCPLGMYVVPSVENLLVWDGVFFVHQGKTDQFDEPHDINRLRILGYYADAILKFRVVFPSNYPENMPSVQFVTDTFHPLVDSHTGEFNMAPRFRPWR